MKGVLVRWMAGLAGFWSGSEGWFFRVVMLGHVVEIVLVFRVLKGRFEFCCVEVRLMIGID